MPQFNLKRPCKDCPFRKDKAPYLHPDRAHEIASDVVHHDAWFVCHKTLEQPESRQEACAGSIIFADKHNMTNGYYRVIERFGGIAMDSYLDKEQVFDTVEDMEDHHLGSMQGWYDEL